LKDSFRRIRLSIRKRNAIVVLCVLLCLPGLAHSQNGEVFTTPTKPGRAATEYVPPPQKADQFEPRIPKLVDHRLVEAQRMVGGLFTLTVVNRKSPSPQDVVLRQLPPPEAPAKPGAAIQIWLSGSDSTPPQAAEPVQVPDLVGQKGEWAAQILKDRHFIQGAVETKDSEESNDIVLSQDPPEKTMVPPNTKVNFTVSRQIQRTLTLTGPSSGKPGDSLTFVARLDPYFPSTQYQFTISPGQSGPWSSNPVLTNTFDSDGNYEVSAFATWDGGKAPSNTIPVTIHSTEYVLTLKPSPVQQLEGNPVEFRADLEPPVENAVYTFNFDDRTKPVRSNTPVVIHVYQPLGPHRPTVTALIPDHKHWIPSSPTQVTILPRPLSPGAAVAHWLNEHKSWIIGGIALLLGGFLLGKLRPGPRNGKKPQPRANIKLRANIPTGTFTIRVQGRLWSRIEDLRAKNGRDHTR
jgi:PASTA domain